MDLVTHFRRMARNNAWSSYRLYEACGQLSADDYRAERTSFFPSIAATLDHILLVDLYYLDAMQGGGLGYPHFSTWTPRPNFQTLREEQRATDRRLIELCDGLSADGIERTIVIDRGPKGEDRETVGDTLSHLFVHQIHHRGQVHAMLSGTMVKPPQLDEYFLVFDAAVRAPDLAALNIEGPEVIR